MTRTDYDADEMRVLALVLDDGRRFDDLERRGGRSLFASKHARTVFDAVVQCRDRHGRVIREVVYGILRQGVGPAEAQILMDHLISEAVYGDWDDSLALLQDRAHRRRIYEAAQAIAQTARNEELSPSEIDAETIRLATEAVSGRELVDAVQIGDVARDLVHRLDQLEAGQSLVKAIPCGLIELNMRLKGLRSGCLYTVGAGTGVGKTHLTLHMAHHAATNGHTVLMVSLEMDRYAIMERLVARYAGKVDWSMRLTPEIKNRIIDGVTKIAGLPFFICDNREIGVRHIQSLARVLDAQWGIDLIVVDYLTMLEDPPGVREKRHAVAHNVKKLRALAGELGVPVLLVSQINRSLTERSDKRPMITDLYESGVIEQHSDAILLLHREEKWADKEAPWYGDIAGIMEIHVAKVRYAEDGARVYAKLDAERSILRDLTPDETFAYLEAIKRAKQRD